MLLTCILLTDTLANWLMAVGAIASVVLLYLTLRKQIQFSQVQNTETKLTRFENQFFNMIQTLNTKIDGLVYTEKINDKNIIYNGASIFKHLSFIYLKVNNASDDKKIEAFVRIRSIYHSNFNQLIHIILYIYDYVNNNNVESDRKKYYEYINLNIHYYLKFIIALYKIYNPRSLGAKKLIKKYRIVKKSDFKNYFASDEQLFKDFMAKVNE